MTKPITLRSLEKKHSLHWNRPTHGKPPTQQLKTTITSHLLVIGLVPHDLWRHEAIRAALACEPVPADPESSRILKECHYSQFYLYYRERERGRYWSSRYILVFLISFSASWFWWWIWTIFHFGRVSNFFAGPVYALCLFVISPFASRSEAYTPTIWQDSAVGGFLKFVHQDWQPHTTSFASPGASRGSRKRRQSQPIWWHESCPPHYASAFQASLFPMLNGWQSLQGQQRLTTLVGKVQTLDLPTSANPLSTNRSIPKGNWIEQLKLK